MRPTVKSSHFILLLAFITLVPGVWAKELCEDKSRFVDSCFSLHGRLFISNGTPSVRIWKVGAKQMLGVINDGDTEGRSLPSEIAKLLTVDVQIFGDFNVCPVTKSKPKEMQIVCLESGKNLVVKKIQRGK